MPTYEYRCEACSHELEEFQYIKDEPLVKCPVCGKRKLKRLISGGAAIVFKGSGFYQTDYRSESYKKQAKSDTAPVATADCSACPKDCPAKKEADKEKPKSVKPR
ncbi:MAG: zinc ribbon domain-containing protein [Planctomycetaceae bacterium]|nr:zinc ribbon domain-containing protein [Planctomycetaceae bacterium]